jgi:hypothetical protein
VIMGLDFHVVQFFIAAIGTAIATIAAPTTHDFFLTLLTLFIH